MAWLDRGQTGIFQLGFQFGGRRFKRSLRTRDERTAEATLHRVEENIRLVSTGRLKIPPEADVPTFLISDGELSSAAPMELPKQLQLRDLFAHYRKSLPTDALSPGTLRIAEIHMKHVLRIIGKSRHLRTITRDDLQRFVNLRSSETGKRSRPVSPTTIKKELSTFRTLWRWARQSEFVASDFPNEGLRFPRQQRKMPFLTWTQIETRIKRGLPQEHLEADYWDCLYLNTSELRDLLADIKQFARYEFVYPMAYLAAHTGARRSELCRSLREDIDFEGRSILMREKKRQKGKETFRHIPLSSSLADVLSEWLNVSTVSAYTFPAEHQVSRCRNRNRRENDCESVSPDEATDHLEKTIRGTRWQKIRGWHIFRHSFISNCASQRVDQRMIDAWVGHQTEEMRQRYRHLFPNRQKVELEKVFE